jgi:N-acetylglucosaminyldiphosphoundecaprenol N-acetyl-beta-D-mannosaminyltransferase
MHRDRLRVPLCMGVGGTLDFLAGTIPRAPRWMQNAGLEWLYRTSQEPGRLAKRYLNDAAGLALHLPPQVALSVAQPRKPVNSAIQAYEAGSSLVVVLSGDVNAGVLSQFEELAQRISLERRHAVLDLALTAYLGPESLGALVRTATMMRRQGLQFWLADLPAHLRRVLRSTHLEHFFAIGASVADVTYRIEKTERLLPDELIAARSLSPEARDHISVQVEVLQDLCARMGSVSENAEFSFAGLRTRIPAGR